MAGRTDDDGDDAPANPGGQFAGQGNAKNGKSRDWIDGAGMGGTSAQDHADRRGKAGRGMVDKDGPIEGRTDTPSQ